jgi:hypothetical protein
MVQLDGTHREWYEKWRAPCVLMVMLDDSNNRHWAQFFVQETTCASYDAWEGRERQLGRCKASMRIGTAFTGA